MKYQAASYRWALNRWLGLIAASASFVSANPTNAQDWKDGDGFRSASLPVPKSGKAGFEKMDPEVSGLAFTNRVPVSLAAQNRITENGAGVALGDIDSDGLCDIYLCRIKGPNELYRNKGEWRFDKITEDAGVACGEQYSTGAAFADVDGDDDLDLLVNGIKSGTRLFINDGNGKFAEKKESGLNRSQGSTSMALGDIDQDGDLDLYVATYRNTTVKDSPPGLNVNVKRKNGEYVATPKGRFEVLNTGRKGGVTLVELGQTDKLYLNDGSGNFQPVSWTSGRFLDRTGTPLDSPPRDWGLSVRFHDMDRDGLLDIYVCNDFFHSRDRIWINQGGGKFQAIGALALRKMSMSSMSVDFADVNRDGHDDVFVADMLSRSHRTRQRQRENLLRSRLSIPFERIRYVPEVPRNTFYLNEGDGTYSEAAYFSGVAASEWSWASLFMDVDLDGYKDLLITNGHGHFVLDADTLGRLAKEKQTMRGRVENLGQFPPLKKRNIAFRNQQDTTFKEVGSKWGFDLKGVSHGMAAGDLDQDGDLDLVVNNQNRAASLYRNVSNAPRVLVRLNGKGANTDGIGARVRFRQSGRTQSDTIIAGGRYLSSGEPVAVFAAGIVKGASTIEVAWPGGKVSRVTNVRPNRLYEINKPKSKRASAGGTQEKSRGRLKKRQAKAEDVPIFEDVSDLLGHRHRENEYNDFKRRPLLPRRLSQPGPGVSWYDFDRDGWQDLIVGAARGQPVSLLKNDRSGGFTSLDGPSAARDQTAVLGRRPSTDQTRLLIGFSNYEDGTKKGAAVGQVDIGRKEANPLLSQLGPSVGPLAMSDLDLDGDLDLFVGSRAIPGRYPEFPSSFIYRNDKDGWHRDKALSKPFKKIGLVKGATFSDLNGDGRPELILACEWGPVRVFQNVGGHFQEVTERLGLSQYPGWWNGVATGDINNDGRLDIVATNWGRNNRYYRYQAYPLQIYYGDPDGDDRLEAIEAYFDPGIGRVVPWPKWDEISRALPFMRKRAESFKEYSNTGLKELLGRRLTKTKGWMANTLDSVVFFNRDEGFKLQPLPDKAQMAPAFGVTVGDYNGDGLEDIFLAQNFFAVRPDRARYDSGRGLWLKGVGEGELKAVSAAKTGVEAYGEQRGCALGDYNRDGRVDLVVTQNDAETKLFRNQRGKPGLRVRLVGPKANRDAIGAQIRAIYQGGEKGPLKEVQAGSGYLAQNSRVQILSRAQPVKKLWVRWPGNHVVESEIPKRAQEIVVNPAGKVTLLK